MYNILIIDDNPEQRIKYSDMIVDNGMRPLTANGKTIDEISRSAIDLFDSNQVHLLILDLNYNLLRGVNDLDWGGIWIYLKLRSCGYIQGMGKDNILVASKYGTENLEAVKPGSEAYVVRVFVELEEIPHENVFYLYRDDPYNRIMKRLNELASSWLP